MPNDNQFAKNIYETHTDGYFANNPLSFLNIFLLKQEKLNPNSIPPAKLYGPDDFNIPGRGRALSALKVGHLLIKSQPGGKGSFGAEVSYLDKDRQQERTLFKFDSERFSGFDFESLFPFQLGDGSMTMVGRRTNDRAFSRTLMTNELAKRVKPFILALAFGEAINPADFQSALTSLITFRQETYTMMQSDVTNTPASVVHDLDMSDFQKDPNLKPHTEHNLAAKIGYMYFAHLGITENELKTIITEYLEESHQTINQLNDDWIERFMGVLIDKNRYSLRMVITKDMLQECIRYYNNQQETLTSIPDSSESITSPFVETVPPLDQENIKAHLDLWDSIHVFGKEGDRLATFYKRLPDEISLFLEANPIPSEAALQQAWILSHPDQYRSLQNYSNAFSTPVSDETRRSITPIADQLLKLAIKMFHANSEDEKTSLRSELDSLLISTKQALQRSPFPPETLQRFDDISRHLNAGFPVIESPQILSDAAAPLHPVDNTESVIVSPPVIASASEATQVSVPRTLDCFAGARNDGASVSGETMTEAAAEGQVKENVIKLFKEFATEVSARLQSRSEDTNQDGEQKKRACAAIGKIEEMKQHFNQENSLKSMRDYLDNNQTALSDTFSQNRSKTWFRRNISEPFESFKHAINRLFNAPPFSPASTMAFIQFNHFKRFFLEESQRSVSAAAPLVRAYR